MSTQTMNSLSISAEAILDLHSLNNEGGEGNQIQTRMVEVIVRDPATPGEVRIESVNAISGDMFKHIQAEHLFRIAQERSLALCGGCRRFNANRISADDAFQSFLSKDKPSSEVVDQLLKTCVIDDLEGILITKGNYSVPRKSVVEFGWVVGRPEQTRSNQYFHVKYNPEQRTKDRSADDSGNEGQAIFHRPANSGVYAIVCHLELGRIGYNDITRQYVLDDAERLQRFRALLHSVLYTFVRPAGAMISTQLPHLVNLRGVVSWSAGVQPAPTFSALNQDFMEQSERVTAALNRGSQQPVVEIRRFEDMAGLSELLMELAEGQPLRLGAARG
ncbi:MAG: CRISPR-associated protein DevR [Herpetosiphonaceae bacterium]|nr:MAG: CRISPR-associated protein DevR [Herpetosiphonaceae bacterium]